jgi:hypothetical protein
MARTSRRHPVRLNEKTDDMREALLVTPPQLVKLDTGDLTLIPFISEGGGSAGPNV